MKKRLAVALLSLPGFLICESQAQWFQPYANGSADDHLLRFDVGPTGTVTAPSPTVGVGYTYSAVPAAGIASGWNASASGSVGLGNGFGFLASSNAFTRVGGQNLRFGADTDSRLLLSGAAGVPITWQADATIPGSNTWLIETNHFRYNFDLALDNQLVDDFPSIYDNFSLTITAGANTLYSGIGLKQILGVGVIDQNMYNDQFVSFDYNQADGPLTITWAGDLTMTAAMINSLGNGTMDILRVHQPSITTEAIPEPATSALLLGSLLLTGARFRRKWLQQA